MTLITLTFKDAGTPDGRNISVTLTGPIFGPDPIKSTPATSLSMINFPELYQSKSAGKPLTGTMQINFETTDDAMNSLLLGFDVTVTDEKAKQPIVTNHVDTLPLLHTVGRLDIQADPLSLAIVADHEEPIAPVVDVEDWCFTETRVEGIYGLPPSFAKAAEVLDFGLRIPGLGRVGELKLEISADPNASQIARAIKRDSTSLETISRFLAALGFVGESGDALLPLNNQNNRVTLDSLKSALPGVPSLKAWIEKRFGAPGNFFFAAVASEPEIVVDNGSTEPLQSVPTGLAPFLRGILPCFVPTADPIGDSLGPKVYMGREAISRFLSGKMDAVLEAWPKESALAGKKDAAVLREQRKEEAKKFSAHLNFSWTIPSSQQSHESQNLEISSIARLYSDPFYEEKDKFKDQAKLIDAIKGAEGGDAYEGVFPISFESLRSHAVIKLRARKIPCSIHPRKSRSDTINAQILSEMARIPGEENSTSTVDFGIAEQKEEEISSLPVVACIIEKMEKVLQIPEKAKIVKDTKSNNSRMEFSELLEAATILSVDALDKDLLAAGNFLFEGKGCIPRSIVVTEAFSRDVAKLHTAAVDCEGNLEISRALNLRRAKCNAIVKVCGEGNAKISGQAFLDFACFLLRKKFPCLGECEAAMKYFFLAKGAEENEGIESDENLEICLFYSRIAIGISLAREKPDDAADFISDIYESTGNFSAENRIKILITLSAIHSILKNPRMSRKYLEISWNECFPGNLNFLFSALEISLALGCEHFVYDAAITLTETFFMKHGNMFSEENSMRIRVRKLIARSKFMSGHFSESARLVAEWKEEDDTLYSIGVHAAAEAYLTAPIYDNAKHREFLFSVYPEEVVMDRCGDATALRRFAEALGEKRFPGLISKSLGLKGFSKTWKFLGIYHKKKRNLQEAIECLDFAATEDPEAVEVWAELTKIHCELKDERNAGLCLGSLLKRILRLPDIQQTQNNDSTICEHGNSLEISSDLSDISYNFQVQDVREVVEHLLTAGLFKEAEVLIFVANRKFQNPRLTVLLARSFEGQKRFKEALLEILTLETNNEKEIEKMRNHANRIADRILDKSAAAKIADAVEDKRQILRNLEISSLKSYDTTLVIEEQENATQN